MKRIIYLSVVATMAMFITSCNTTQTLYSWYNYEDIAYEYNKEPTERPSLLEPDCGVFVVCLRDWATRTRAATSFVSKCSGSGARERLEKLAQRGFIFR